MNLFRKKNIVCLIPNQDLVLPRQSCQFKRRLLPFSRIFISCQSRQCDLQEFFEHENQKFPPSLSQNGLLNTGGKLQLILILEADHEVPNAEPCSVETLVIDGVSLVNSIKTWIKSLVQNHLRVDVDFDVYYVDSLKGETIRKRIHRIWMKSDSFLRCDEQT